MSACEKSEVDSFLFEAKKNEKPPHIALPLDITHHVPKGKVALPTSTEDLYINVSNMSHFHGIVVAELAEMHSMQTVP